MATVFLNIAGFNIMLNFYQSKDREEVMSLPGNIKSNVCSLLKGFIKQEISGQADYRIDLYKHHITMFHKKVNKKMMNFLNFYTEESERIITFQHISFTHFMLLVKIILQKLLSKNKGFIFHTSALNFKGKAMLFTGEPGAGKSTVMKFLSEKYLPLADDSVIIKKEESRFYVYQTPFMEKNSWFEKTNSRYEVGKIFLLKKASVFKTKKIIKKDKIIDYFSRQIWTEDSGSRKQIRYFLEFVNYYSQFHLLYFAKDKDRLTKFIENLN